MLTKVDLSELDFCANFPPRHSPFGNPPVRCLFFLFLFLVRAHLFPLLFFVDKTRRSMSISAQQRFALNLIGCVGPSSDTAGKAASCAGCPNQKLCASGAAKQEDPALKVVANNLEDVKHTILVLSGKGGVGKSTVSTQLALSLARQGKEVGLLDIDLCGPSIPRMLGIVGEQVHQSGSGWSPVYVEDIAVMSIGFLLGNTDRPVIWRGPRKNGLIKQFLTDVDWGELDYLIIDTPPGTSDEHISMANYLKHVEVDGAVVVTTPQEVRLA